MGNVIQIIRAAHGRKLLKKYKEARSRAQSGQSPRRPSETTGSKRRSWIGRECITLYVNAITHGTLCNHLLVGLISLLLVICTIYGLYALFALAWHFTALEAVTQALIYGLILTLCCAYIATVRYIVYSVLTMFASSTGRQALFTYALFLVLGSPMTNTLINVSMLAEVIPCNQEMAHEALKKITDSVLQPLNSLRESLVNSLEFIDDLIHKLRPHLDMIKNMMSDVVGTVKKAWQWLAANVSLCNLKMGSPYARCVKSFQEGTAECLVKVPSFLKPACILHYLVSKVCLFAKALDFVCDAYSWLSENFFTPVARKLRDFGTYIKRIFQVEIIFDHSYSYEGDESVSLKEVMTGVMADIKRRLHPYIEFCKIIRHFLFGFIPWAILKSLWFIYCYLNYEWYQNKYINDHLMRIDIMRSNDNLSTIFPLTYRERLRYVKLSSLRLTLHEWRNLFSGLGLTIIMMITLFTSLFFEYSIWWILRLMREYGRVRIDLGGESVQLEKKESGFQAELFKWIFEAGDLKVNFDNLRCLPNPISPDPFIYMQLGFILLLIFVLTILEPLATRLRHYVTDYYFEDAARRRAIWLYHHILYERTTFSNYLRRYFRNEIMFNNYEKPTITNFLLRKLPFLKIFIGRFGRSCLLCERLATELCGTPGCKGAYCKDCYAQMQNRCSLCNEVE